MLPVWHKLKQRKSIDRVPLRIISKETMQHQHLLKSFVFICMVEDHFYPVATPSLLACSGFINHVEQGVDYRDPGPSAVVLCALGWPAVCCRANASEWDSLWRTKSAVRWRKAWKSMARCVHCFGQVYHKEQALTIAFYESEEEMYISFMGWKCARICSILKIRSFSNDLFLSL